MLCAVDNFPLVLARFPVKPGMTTDRALPLSSRARFLPVISTERSEWRDLSTKHAPKNVTPSPQDARHVPHSPQDARHTVRQFFERFPVGRCQKRRQDTRKRDRPSCFSPF